MSRDLARLQREFAALLLAPHPPRGPAAIYHHNRRANFRKALALGYPLIARIVGDEFFERLAGEYLRAQPSRSGDLQQIGGGFAHFLAAGCAAAGSGYEYLVDLARLEWAWQSALLAADAPALGVAALAEIAPLHWPRLRCRLQPAMQVIESRWPLYTLFVEQRREQPAIVHLDAGAERVGVLRRGAVVEVHRLEPGVAALWRALAAGATLEAAVEAAMQAAAGRFELAPKLAELFALGGVVEIGVADADA